MTEGLADAGDDATPELAALYGRWSERGVGLLVSGNVMIDRRYLERAGNVVIDADSDRSALRAWAEAGSRNGTAMLAQLSHPGRQCTRFHSRQPVAPSAVALRVRGLFARPRALSDREIEGLIDAFALAAASARAAGFAGVQLHAAHGYLMSQFLSPRSNRRSDRWGGDLAGRARFLLATVRAVRMAIGPDAALAVKLNAADFLRGGFEHDEAVRVAGWLAEAGIDLLELSGGTYERLAFVEVPREAGATRAREAYFLRYASDVKRALAGVPLMVSGGFRTPAVMASALASGEVDVIGIGRPFCVEPALAARLRAGDTTPLPAPERSLRVGAGPLGPRSASATVRALNAQGATAWFYEQQLRLAAGLEPTDRPGWAGAVLARHLRREVGRAWQRDAT